MACNRLQFGTPTRLYDAIDASVDPLQDIEGRKVALVFTDGEDTQHADREREVLDKARARRSDDLHHRPREQRTSTVCGRCEAVRTAGSRRFAEETGGGHFELKDTDDLGPTCTRVAQELHRQFVVGLAPSVQDGKLHELDVRVREPR